MLELLNTMGTFEAVLNIFLHSKMAMRAGRKTQKVLLFFLTSLISKTNLLKERINSWNLSSDLYMCVAEHTYTTCTHRERESKCNKKF